jgi:Domain of unknown function (DUF1839)
VTTEALPRRAAAIADLDPGNYRRHSLHSPQRAWVEKNCYADIWIELLHALQLEPLAMLAFTVAVDFEGDQWTFFKPPHEDLRLLYGVDVQELYAWRPLLEHALEHLSAGKLLSTEADAFWLPDTEGSDYRRQHTKTTIVLCEVDADAQRLSYFHNAGYFTLSGEDFARLFRVDAPPDPSFMPLYVEQIRHDRARRADLQELRSMGRDLLSKHLRWRPAVNPMPAFQARFVRDLPGLTQQGLPQYHAWAFGTFRQLGAASELSAQFLQWLDPGAGSTLAPAATAFLEISDLCKAFILKAARAVNAKRALDATASFEQLAAAWDRASSTLRAAQ